MLTDCYEAGHTPGVSATICLKCEQELYAVTVNGATVWHTQAELDRLWKGVDRGVTDSLDSAITRERHGA